MAEVRETGRLFRPEMVCATIDRRKTVTRRPLKLNCSGHVKEVGGHRRWHPGDPDAVAACPWGVPGDRIWVRETCRAIELESGLDCVEYLADGAIIPIDNTPEAGEAWLKLRHYRGQRGAKVPSIHMPRWASRITLEITSVRVERLQDIREEDAQREGLSQITKDDGLTWKWGIADRDGLPGSDNHGWPWKEWAATAVGAFAKLWSSINGPDSWAANPWVWVIEYKVLEVRHG